MEWGDRDENDYRLVPGTYMTVNEYRRSLMPYDLNIYTNPLFNSSTTTATTLVYGSSTYQQPKYLVSYSDASWVPEPAKPAKVKKERPETDMQWLKRRISEVSWVPV